MWQLDAHAVFPPGACVPRLWVLWFFAPDVLLLDQILHAFDI